VSPEEHAELKDRVVAARVVVDQLLPKHKRIPGDAERAAICREQLDVLAGWPAEKRDEFMRRLAALVDESIRDRKAPQALASIELLDAMLAEGFPAR
jgi:hypothetical protein